MKPANNVWLPSPRNCIANRTLRVNECCLSIVSQFNGATRLYTKESECVECDYVFKKPSVLPNQETSFILSTEYPLEFYIDNGEKLCNASFWFGNWGWYIWNVSENSCGIIEVKDPPESYWLNVGVFISVFAAFLLSYCLYQCVLTKCLHSTYGHVSFSELEADLGNLDARCQNNSYVQAKRRKQPRVASIDVFRGIAIAIMIFVNCGGGGYTIFRHSPWNGLTVADLVFPWFIWIMGFSIALSFRSKLRTSISRRKIFGRIIKRALLLIALGLVLNSGKNNNRLSETRIDTFTSLRIPGVLQRIGVTYFLVASVELLFSKPQRSERFGPWCFFPDVIDSLTQWIIAILFAVAHGLITFLLPVPGCPTGYIGPGGFHEHSKFENCTGGAAGYIDRLVFRNSHLYQHPTFKKIYHTHLPYDPEGLLGTLTCVFCGFLGVHAGRIILCYENTYSRIKRWIIWGLCIGTVAGALCNFSENAGPIPINKNLWSISYVLATSSLAFLIFSFLYWLVDYRHISVGLPFLYAGMNALVLYVGHEVLQKFLPWYWYPFTGTHSELLGMNLFTTFIWIGIACLLYRRNIFIVL